MAKRGRKRPVSWKNKVLHVPTRYERNSFRENHFGPVNKKKFMNIEIGDVEEQHKTKTD